ncbi:MAG TPA: TIGR03086 family metal-binding protein [Actinomycetota bacterium]|nr:TIGR03086 family metal-binding protein [Actinomycetota bacterium]
MIPDDIGGLHRRSVATFDRLVHAIDAGRWDLATPCAEWTVRDLVNHLTNENLWAEALFGGRTIVEVGGAFDGDVLGEDPVAAWEAASRGALERMGEPDAMDRLVDLSRGPTPGREYAVELFADHVMHSWDLAKAIGTDDALDPALVAAAKDWFGDVEDAYRAAGSIAERPPVPPDADDQTIFLAMTGRSRDWAPPA